MLLLILAACVAGGCSTFAGRVKEKTATFAALDAPTQARLKDGVVNLGDTADMAYIALGEPDEKRDQVSADGNAIVWVYHRHWQEYRGERVMGYHSVTAPDPKTGVPTVYYEPLAQSVYQDREEERLRVTFKDGKVAVIERPKAQLDAPAGPKPGSPASNFSLSVFANAHADGPENRP